MALAVALMLGIGASMLVKLVIEPNLEDVSKLRAEAVVSRTINRALADLFQETDPQEELFTVKTGKDGALAMVQADSLKINLLMSSLSMNLQDAFRQMEREQYEVPAGALLGSKILSQTGPFLTVEIMPMSVSSMDFRTEFASQGINQTKYKIYIELDCRIKVLAPFCSRIFHTTSTVLVAEAVILGEVPESYVQVPKEDILDVIGE